MLDINGTEFRAIVLRAIQNVLAEQELTKPKRMVYVVFEDSFDVRYDSFLQDMTESDAVTAIVPDDWSQDLYDRIKRNCPFCQIIGQAAAGSLPLEGSLTVYPVISRSLLVKAALGMDDTFQSRWLTQCYSAGSAVHMMLSGFTKFTGREPAGYVQQILSYIERLLTFDISIGSYPTNGSVPEVVPLEPPAVVTLRSHIITAADIAPLAKGAVVHIDPSAIVTAYAAEEAERQEIQFIRFHH